MPGPTVPSRRAFNARLLRWHRSTRRPLAIRGATSPWQILVAEVMSQQTQIERIGPIWQRFIDRWPTADDLARAPTHDLLAAWSGLGYNRRALALRAAARTIVADHGGRVPATVDALECLPGIGPYTARAVAASAFGMSVAPLDVNVRRVIARVLGETLPDRRLQVAADDLVSRTDPRRWVDAVMDLAATICTRSAPACGGCPVAAVCASRGVGVVVGPSRPRRITERFEATNRWLRGRLVALLVGAADGAWVALPVRLGDHDADAIACAARGLERDGFLELAGGSVRLRMG